MEYFDFTSFGEGVRSELVEDNIKQTSNKTTHLKV